MVTEAPVSSSISSRVRPSSPMSRLLCRRVDVRPDVGVDVEFGHPGAVGLDGGDRGDAHRATAGIDGHAISNGL